MSDAPDPQIAPPSSAQVPWRAVAVFTVAALGLGWLSAWPLWSSPQGLADPFAIVFLLTFMFTPTLAVVLTILVMRVPRGQIKAFLGIWPLGRLGRFFGYLGVAFALPVVVVVLAAFLAAGFGWLELDLVGFSGLDASLGELAPPGTPLPPMWVLFASQLAALPVGALVNSVTAAGEEIGWRGWLHSALRPLGLWPTLAIVGVIWGLWHAPVILLGYNYGRTDIVGVLLMTAACVAWAVLLGALRELSGSVWPAVLAHGSLNAVGGFALLIFVAGTEPDLALVGPVGVSAMIVIGAVVGIAMIVGRFRGRSRSVPA